MHNNQYVVHMRMGACVQDCKSLLIMHPLVASSPYTDQFSW